jgi:hypothetical protein
MEFQVFGALPPEAAISHLHYNQTHSKQLSNFIEKNPIKKVKRQFIQVSIP